MANILSFIPNITKLFKSQGSKKTKSPSLKKDAFRLKAVFLIVDWDKLHTVTKVFEKEQCLLSYVSKGSGTANSEILSMLGIGATDKAVFLCVAPATDTHRLVLQVQRTMGAGSVGAGIAFSVPLGGVSARIFTMFEDAARAADVNTTQDRAKETKAMDVIEIKNELIISILNRGNSDAFMAEARKAGARGGTVINSRGISQEVMKNFLNISVQEEKEIILILADKDKSADIMGAVKTDFGSSSKAAGVIFSLPVDRVTSLNALL
jgi:nitrogen regulatory protein PII